MQCSRAHIPAPGSLRFLVIGCGSIGKRHIANLIELKAREIIAFDALGDRRREVGSRFSVEVVDDMGYAWQRKPHVALITVPTNLHVPYALEAAQQGCHLFIEKPLSDCMEGMGQLLESVDKRGLVTLVGCNMRFHPGPRRVKDLIEKGVIGRTLFARLFGGSYLPDWHPWEDYRCGYSAHSSMGGGCILDGIHEIDLARWFLGEVKTVAAMANRISGLELDVEDVASTILQHVGGQHSEVHLDYVQRVRVRGCLIAGAEGSVAWDWTDHRVRWYRADQARWYEERLPPEWSLNQMYADEIAHFVQCVLDERATCNPVSEAAVVNQIALAAKKSSQDKRFVDIREVMT